MAAGNFLRNLEERFVGLDEETIAQIAEESLIQFIQESGMTNAEPVFNAMVMIAKIGLEANGSLSDKQKRLVDANFSKIYKGQMDTIYSMLTREVTDQEYDMMKLFCQVGQDRVGIPLLTYILSYAYIDGKPSAALDEKLESIFGMVLLQYYFDGEPEDEEDSTEAEPDEHSFRCFVCGNIFAKKDGVELSEDFYVCKHCHETEFGG